MNSGKRGGDQILQKTATQQQFLSAKDSIFEQIEDDRILQKFWCRNILIPPL
jgi:hypothetical protein